jgi:hypothetical protein
LDTVPVVAQVGLELPDPTALGSLAGLFGIPQLLVRLQRPWRQIGRYHGGWPAWDFVFRRKIGGDASVRVLLREEKRKFTGEFKIHASWYWDDYDTKRRHTRQMKPPFVFPRGGDPGNLLDLLEQALATIDAWEMGQWDEIAPPYREWRRLTREEFESEPPHLPPR